MNAVSAKIYGTNSWLVRQAQYNKTTKKNHFMQDFLMCNIMN